MNIPETIKTTLKSEGRTQKWVVAEMNKIDPQITMDPVKFSAIVCGKRKLQGDELLAFCKATGISPDVFLT